MNLLILIHFIKTSIFITKTCQSEYQTEIHVKLPLIFPGRLYIKEHSFSLCQLLTHKREAESKAKPLSLIPPTSLWLPSRVGGRITQEVGVNRIPSPWLFMPLSNTLQIPLAFLHHQKVTAGALLSNLELPFPGRDMCSSISQQQLISKQHYSH